MYDKEAMHPIKVFHLHPIQIFHLAEASQLGRFITLASMYESNVC